MKIAIYFNSGNKAVFERDKVHVLCKPIFNPKEYIEDDGVVIVNWDNVCFMKVVEEKTDDDE